MTTNTSYYSELDAYSYAGSAGQVLSVALWGPTDCGAFTENDSMEADIYSPSGQLLTTLVSGCTGAALNLTLTNSGTYTILVHDHDYNNTGSYAISLRQ